MSTENRELSSKAVSKTLLKEFKEVSGKVIPPCSPLMHELFCLTFCYSHNNFISSSLSLTLALLIEMHEGLKWVQSFRKKKIQQNQQKLKQNHLDLIRSGPDTNNSTSKPALQPSQGF